MATNKQLVEQAVAAIPLWQAFLDQKEAEQDAILAEMQDDEAQFAPKSLTQRLTERFRPTLEQPEQLDQISTLINNLDIPEGVDQIKLEKDVRKEEEAVEVEEAEEALVEEEYEPVSSESEDRQPANNKDFKDLF